MAVSNFFLMQDLRELGIRTCLHLYYLMADGPRLLQSRPKALECGASAPLWVDAPGRGPCRKAAQQPFYGVRHFCTAWF